mmetsp:Transcript_23342/g.39026  ORF Transcript_23342/g.39026 Transcript_23342/m.39026 type:complete len:430 (-) Transcript_23342:669-1958(-)
MRLSRRSTTSRTSVSMRCTYCHIWITSSAVPLVQKSTCFLSTSYCCSRLRSSESVISLAVSMAFSSTSRMRCITSTRMVSRPLRISLPRPWHAFCRSSASRAPCSPRKVSVEARFDSSLCTAIRSSWQCAISSALSRSSLLARWSSETCMAAWRSLDSWLTAAMVRASAAASDSSSRSTDARRSVRSLAFCVASRRSADVSSMPPISVACSRAFFSVSTASRHSLELFSRSAFSFSTAASRMCSWSKMLFSTLDSCSCVSSTAARRVSASPSICAATAVRRPSRPSRRSFASLSPAARTSFSTSRTSRFVISSLSANLSSAAMRASRSIDSFCTNSASSWLMRAESPSVPSFVSKRRSCCSKESDSATAFTSFHRLSTARSRSAVSLAVASAPPFLTLRSWSSTHTFCASSSTSRCRAATSSASDTSPE